MWPSGNGSGLQNRQATAFRGFESLHSCQYLGLRNYVASFEATVFFNMASKKWKKQHVEEMRAYRRKHYANNKEVYKARAIKRRKAAKEWLHEIKKSLKCSRCSEDFWACLEFHHLDAETKDVTLAEMYKRGWCIERMKKELVKCVVLCANCHRKEHYGSVG